MSEPVEATPTWKYRLDFLKGHIVYKNSEGKRVPGVTTVIGILDKPALGAWHNRMGLQGVDTAVFVQKAADLGTITHARVEAHLRGMELDESNLPPDMVAQSMNGYRRFLGWWQSHELEVEHSELPMVSDEWGVGGTADIVARDRDGRRLLVDIKTSGGIYREMRMQASAYAAILGMPHLEHDGAGWNAAEPQPVDQVWVVRIGKEAVDDVEPVEVTNREKCVEAFATCAQLYRQLQGIR